MEFVGQLVGLVSVQQLPCRGVRHNFLDKRMTPIQARAAAATYIPRVIGSEYRSGDQQGFAVPGKEQKHRAKTIWCACGHATVGFPQLGPDVSH